METLTLDQKIESILRQRFQAPAQVIIQNDNGIMGTVTSEEFHGLETLDRLNLIWDVLTPCLSRAERREVSIIVPKTPQEEELDREDA